MLLFCFYLSNQNTTLQIRCTLRHSSAGSLLAILQLFPWLSVQMPKFLSQPIWSCFLLSLPNLLFSPCSFCLCWLPWCPLNPSGMILPVWAFAFAWLLHLLVLLNLHILSHYLKLHPLSLHSLLLFSALIFSITFNNLQYTKEFNYLFYSFLSLPTRRNH